MRAYKVITPAVANVVTLSEVKSHLKVDTTADDTLITNLISAAQASCEEYTNRLFIRTTLVQYSDNWNGISELFKSPVKTITNIKYYDTDNVLQTLAASVYQIDKAYMPTRVALQPDQSFPSVANRINAIEVTYDVGEADAANVSDGIKQAVLLTIGHWYQNRESVVIGRISTEIPMTSKYLLDQYKIQVIR